MWERGPSGETEFVYLLAWPNEAEKNAAWPGSWLNEEWKEIKRVTSAKQRRSCGRDRGSWLVATAYSPSRV